MAYAATIDAHLASPSAPYAPARDAQRAAVILVKDGILFWHGWMATPHAAYALVATYLRILEARLEEAIHARQAKKAKQEAHKRARGYARQESQQEAAHGSL